MGVLGSKLRSLREAVGRLLATESSLLPRDANLTLKVSLIFECTNVLPTGLYVCHVRAVPLEARKGC